jgi:hypothetical protein
MAVQYLDPDSLISSSNSAPPLLHTQSGQCDSNSMQCHQNLISGFLIAAVFITLAYRRWGANAKRQCAEDEADYRRSEAADAERDSAWDEAL